jgi:chemotaxis response regulator CheB
MARNRKLGNVILNTKVVILHSKSLFAAGIESLLREEGGLEVTYVDAAGDEANDQIDRIMPDVIIMDVNDDDIAARAAILGILSQNNLPKMIGLSLKSHEISIYHRESRAALSGADLVAAINA